jgi:hypothetical protein
MYTNRTFYGSTLSFALLCRRRFLQELKSIYKQLRSFRYWLSLTTLTSQISQGKHKSIVEHLSIHDPAC